MDKPEDIEAKAWNCSEYPDWLRAMVEAANEVADRLGMSTEQIVAWVILSAQSQAYTDAARIAEKDGETELSWANMELPVSLGPVIAKDRARVASRISAAILQRKEEMK